MNISFVLPTKNEESSISEILTDIKSECQNLNLNLKEIIITDDSTDETRSLAEKQGARIIIGGGQGLGRAMQLGLNAALSKNPDIVISMDSDGQVDISEIEQFIKPIIDNEADLVIGSRFLNKNSIHYKYKRINRFGVIILSRILKKLTKQKITDSHGGIRAMRSQVIENLELIGTHTYVQETIIDAVEKGFKIKEIPSVWNERKFGNSRIVSSIPKYIFYTLPILLLRAGTHIKVLYPLGILLLFFSVLDLIIVLFETQFSLKVMFDRQSFHLIILLFLSGTNLLIFGFLLEIVTNMKRKLNKL